MSDKIHPLEDVELTTTLALNEQFSQVLNEKTVGGMELANELYDNRSKNHKSNLVHVDRIFN